MRSHSLKINAVLNMIRKGSAILFPIITFSYASHKLGADGMGMYSFSNSVISYLLLFAGLGISTYAVREGQKYRNENESLKQFICEVYTINFVFTIISYVILGILLLVWSKLAGYREILLILSISIMLTTLGADWINTLLEDYLFITVRFIVVQLFCLIILLVMVKGPEDILRYAVIGMLSSAGGNILNIIHIRRKIHFHLTLKPYFKKHLPPMLTLFSNSLAIKIYVLADVTILGVYMANKDVGYYTAASKIYTSVKEMLNALIFVTVPRFSYYISHNNKEEYRHSYIEVYNGIVTLILPCIIGLTFQADNILYYLGGADYIQGSEALQILSLAMFFAVSACLFSQSILIPYKQEKYFLRATIVSAITNIVLNFVLIPRLGINAAALTTLISEAIVCIMLFNRGKLFMDEAVVLNRDVKTAIIGSISIVIVCFTFRILIKNRLISLLISIIASCLTYFMLTYVLKNSVVRSGSENIVRRLHIKKNG